MDYIDDILDFTLHVEEVVSNFLPGKSRHPTAVEARRLRKLIMKETGRKYTKKELQELWRKST